LNPFNPSLTSEVRLTAWASSVVCVQLKLGLKASIYQPSEDRADKALVLLEQAREAKDPEVQCPHNFAFYHTLALSCLHCVTRLLSASLLP
jgi:hypothetical protein